MKTLTPKQVADAQLGLVPQWFLNVVNDLMIVNFNNKSKAGFLKVPLADVIKNAIAVAPEPLTKELIRDRRWLELGEIYSRTGWQIQLVYPERDDNFEAYFEFRETVTSK